MRAAIPLVASIGLHVAVVATLAFAPRPAAPAAQARRAMDVEVAPRVVVTQVAPPVTEPIDVVILDEPLAALPAPLPTPAPHPRTASVTVPVSASASASETVPVPVPVPVPDSASASSSASGPGALAMRLPGRNGATVDPTGVARTLERIAADGKSPPPPAAPSGLLHSAPGGERIKHDGPYTARVHRDGTVDLTDDPNVQWSWKLPRPSKIGRAVANHLEDWSDDPYGTATGTELVKKNRRPDKPPGDDDDDDPMVIIPVLGAKFDVNDALERLAGNDPYAARKLAFLDQTRDERAQMGAVEQTRQLAATEQTIRQHLAALWARRDLALAAKKRALFELWDDCAEAGDARVVDAGRRARAQVIGFIRARLPAAGASAYTVDELAALNRARTSKEAFAPYPADAAPATTAPGP